MAGAAGADLRTLKRRQALRVAAFLAAVAAATIGVFHLVHRDLVAYRRGIDALARGDKTHGAELLARAIDRGLKLPPARAELARTYLELGRPRDALPLYEQLAREQPGSAGHLDTVVGLYQSLGEPERGLALYAARGPRESLAGADLVRLGDLHQQARQFDDAIACYRLASARLPGNSEVLARLGIVLSWTGRETEAEEVLTRAVAREPVHRLARIYLARVAVHNGRYEEAVEQYRKVLPP